MDFVRIMHPLKFAVTTCFTATLALGLWVLKDEWHVVQASNYMMAAATPSGPELESQEFLYRSRHPSTGREALYLANANARLAAVEKDPLRRRVYVDFAVQLVDDALASRPKWANAWVTKSYVATLVNPADPRAGLSEYEQSYNDASFLRDSGGWRVAYGSARWNLISNRMKSHVINEAAWLSIVSESEYRNLSLTLIGTAAEVPFLVERAKLLKDVGRPDG